MKCLIPALIALALSACSTPSHIAASKPDLAAAIKTNQSVIDNLTSAQQDSMAIQQAISALRASNIALHKLSVAMSANLDRADYKTAILLK